AGVHGGHGGHDRAGGDGDTGRREVPGRAGDHVVRERDREDLLHDERDDADGEQHVVHGSAHPVDGLHAAVHGRGHGGGRLGCGAAGGHGGHGGPDRPGGVGGPRR